MPAEREQVVDGRLCNNLALLAEGPRKRETGRRTLRIPCQAVPLQDARLILQAPGGLSESRIGIPRIIELPDHPLRLLEPRSIARCPVQIDRAPREVGGRGHELAPPAARQEALLGLGRQDPQHVSMSRKLEVALSLAHVFLPESSDETLRGLGGHFPHQLEPGLVGLELVMRPRLRYVAHQSGQSAPQSDGHMSTPHQQARLRDLVVLQEEANGVLRGASIAIVTGETCQADQSSEQGTLDRHVAVDLAIHLPVRNDALVFIQVQGIGEEGVACLPSLIESASPMFERQVVEPANGLDPPVRFVFGHPLLLGACLKCGSLPHSSRAFCQDTAPSAAPRQGNAKCKISSAKCKTGSAPASGTSTSAWCTPLRPAGRSITARPPRGLSRERTR